VDAEIARDRPAGGAAAPRHTVEFYPDDAFPAARIATMVQRSLSTHRGAAAIARGKNLDALREQLRALGVDLSVAFEAGSLRLIEAESLADETWLNGELQTAVLEERVLRPLQTGIARFGRVFAFGELVDVFVERGHRDAAIVLEHWWNRQVAANPIELHCAYSLRGFADADGEEPFRHICDAHEAVLESRAQARIDHLLELQHIMARLGEAVTVADVSRVLVTAARERLGADTVALYVEELGRWHELITGERHATLPGVAFPLRVRDQLIGALVLGLSPERSRDAAHRALIQDVVHQTAHALDRARAYDAAASANRVKDEFLAMLGHELRNPLSPIVTALQLMRMRGDEHFRKERAVIERQVGSLVGLIDSLLDISRITRGKVTIERRQADLGAIVMQAIEHTSTAMSEAGQDLRLDLPPGIVIEADPARLAQAIANVLGNAAKYSPPGGKIDLVVHASPARIRIEITDHGEGIADTLLPRVFELFVQGRQASDRARGGLGLGLAISKAIVELHGGVIGAYSAGPGSGSTFTIELPRLAHVRLHGDPAAPPRARGRRILLVDDNHDAAAMLADALRQLGHEVELSHDGASGLGLAKSMRPEIAILDLGLPGMDGYTLARELRTELSESCPVLIAVTGYGQPSDRQRSAEAGFSAHFVKPVALEKLEEALRHLDN